MLAHEIGDTFVVEQKHVQKGFLRDLVIPCWDELIA